MFQALNKTWVACTHIHLALSSSSFQSHNVYINSETSFLHEKSKLRNAWGQYKRVSTLRGCFRELKNNLDYSCWLPFERLRHQPTPDLYLIADGQWQLLRPMLLSAALDFLEPHGSHGWAPPNSITNSIEPICSALNLCRFLLLREQAHSSNYTEVRQAFFSRMLVVHQSHKCHAVCCCP